MGKKKNKHKMLFIKTDLAKASFADDGHKLEIIDSQGLTTVGLIWNSNLDFPCTTDKIIPLVVITHSIEVWHELEAA